MKNNSSWLVSLLLLITVDTYASQSPDRLRIYFDSDRTTHYLSARSIEMGVKTAFDEVDNQINGIPVDFITLDHRGNVKRSKKNMSKYMNDTQAIALFAGLHSPPLIKYREYINTNKLLILNPWAAGGPITRYPSSENYIFRLSVDDTKVGKKLVEFAHHEQCNNIHLLLEQTPWGMSNQSNMDRALKEKSISDVKTTWFSWGINDSSARVIASDIDKTGADCILFVGNSTEGSLLVEAMSGLDTPPKIYSHWGITGGTFADKVPYEVRSKVLLKFIQSCFNFYSSPETEFSQQVFSRAQRLFPNDIASKHIDAPAGFVHGYDLTRLFIKATNSVTFSDNVENNRTELKKSLENITEPVQGLIKNYQLPFSQFSENNLDAHEALSANDLCIAAFTKEGAIKLIDSSKIDIR